MKTLGLIGGLSYVSTIPYYQIINEQIEERAGRDISPGLILYSLNFKDYRALAEAGNWKQMENMLTDVSNKLANAGAEGIVICSNTPHIIADGIRTRINIPLINIAEETAKEISKHNIKKVGLLGTKFTMENTFYQDKLSQFNIETIVPDADDRKFIHSTILNELIKDTFTPETKAKYLEIIDKLIQQGAEAIILGCTEINLLIKQKDCDVPVFDTIQIHCNAAIDFILS